MVRVYRFDRTATSQHCSRQIFQKPFKMMLFANRVWNNIFLVSFNSLHIHGQELLPWSKSIWSEQFYNVFPRSNCDQNKRRKRLEFGRRSPDFFREMGMSAGSLVPRFSLLPVSFRRDGYERTLGTRLECGLIFPEERLRISLPPRRSWGFVMCSCSKNRIRRRRRAKRTSE